ncbi:MAG: pyruvate kinase [Lachnospiraceae bacterium]
MRKYERKHNIIFKKLEEVKNKVIMRRIKIYGTFGPNCNKKEILEQMIDAGMTGIRLNLSHTNLVDSKEWIENLKMASEKTGKKIDLAIDLEGPELRIGEVDGKINVHQKDKLYLGAAQIDDSFVDYSSNLGEKWMEREKNFIAIPKCLAEKLKVGQEISINDGIVKLVVDELESGTAVCTVKTEGEISSRKSISIDGVQVDNPVLTKKDFSNLAAAREYGVTEVMLPFVRGEKDIEEVRTVLKELDLDDIKILAKIEHQEGVQNIENIIGKADCIVIARGDLGNRFPIWKVPGIQKMISKKCREKNQEFMVVTQMLNSMIQNPTPTRAEVLDIYNAVLDGATSLMVTGETAVGKYPVEVIKYMTKIAKEAIEN